jgi:hypothetical protein
VALNDVEVHEFGKTVDKDDAASYESHQGIVRTVEVSIDWHNDRPGSGMRRERDTVVPHAITNSERIQ